MSDSGPEKLDYQSPATGGHRRPLDYHRSRQPRFAIRTLYIVLISLFVAAAVLFGTCWVALH
jgi:hypothetical protein